jgi:hypothetical protein
MSKELKLDITPKGRSLTDILNGGHVGVEFYVHNPRGTAPMMYYIHSNREQAEADAATIEGATVFVRDVSEWRVAP